MIDTSKGKIFLSTERGHTEMDWFRSYNTFNIGSYQNENKKAFGILYVLNDDTIAAGKKINYSVEDDTIIILIPVVGVINYYDSNGNTGVVKAGETVVFSIASGGYIEFTNPLEEDLVNCLHLWFKTSANNGREPHTVSFDIDAHKNLLVPLYAQCFISSYISKFQGREEIIHKLSDSANGVFIFVLQGAFEVQYRLLESRDGLAIWNVNEVEIEALSNDAIILLIELPLTDETPIKKSPEAIA